VQVVFEPSGVMALHDKEGKSVRKEPDITTETEPSTEQSETPRSGGEIEELRDTLQKTNEQITELQLEVESLKKAQVSQGKARIKEIWQNSCEELLKHDEELAAKNKEIVALKKALSTSELQSSDSQSVCSDITTSSAGRESRKNAGRAPTY